VDDCHDCAVPAPTQPASDRPRVWTVVVAAGQSTRFGRPKLLEDLAGKRVVDHAVEAAVAASDGVTVVSSLPAIADGLDVDSVVAGGATRSESVRAGLATIPADVEFVLVHDAARPGAGADIFAAVITALRNGADAVVPAVALVDTIKRVDGEVVVGTVDRSSLVAVQTPQGFGLSQLRAAHAAGGDATDDAGLIEVAGGKVVTVPGDANNSKITTEHDLAVARATWFLEIGSVE